MLGGRVSFRIAVGVSPLSKRVFGHRQPIVYSSGLFRNAAYVNRTSILWQRSYATPGKPKKGSVGESSPKVRRAVKKDASVKAQEAEAKKAARAERTQLAAAKKKALADAKKEKEKIKKAKLKEKEIAKKARAKETAAKKAKKTVKAPKALTEKQRARLAAKKQQSLLVALKAAALLPPKIAKLSAWQVMFAEFNKRNAGNITGGQSGFLNQAKETSNAAAAAYRELSPAQLENYNHIATERKKHSVIEYKAWVEAHTPGQILEANRARATLTRIQSKGPKKSRAWPPIKDERAVKKYISPYVAFTVDRSKSGDLKHITLGDRAKLVAQEWKALSEAEKQPFITASAQDKSRWESAYSSTYGHPPKPRAVTASAV